VGSLIPIAAERFGVDPAVLSAPLITTLVDATGLIIYFRIAKVILRL
jgi:magnesium transporter